MYCFCFVVYLYEAILTDNLFAAVNSVYADI